MDPSPPAYPIFGSSYPQSLAKMVLFSVDFHKDSPEIHTNGGDSMKVFIAEIMFKELEQAGDSTPIYGRMDKNAAVLLTTTPNSNLYLVGLWLNSPPMKASQGWDGSLLLYFGPDRIPQVKKIDSGILIPADEIHLIKTVTDVLSRIQGILDCGKLLGKKVAFLGAGSVGGPIGKYLVQSGVGQVILDDGGIIKPANASRYYVGLESVGTSKVQALADVLTLVNPGLEVGILPINLCLESREQIQEAFTGSDLVVVATDSVRTNLLCQEITWELGIPTCFVGVYERAMGGECFFSVPGQTACYHCLRASFNTPEETHSGPIDYTSADSTEVKAEPGLSVDVGFIALASAKQCLAWLTGETGLETALDIERPLLLVGNKKEWIFSRPFQFSRVAVLQNPDCWVCGEQNSEQVSGKFCLSNIIDGNTNESTIGG